MREEPSTIHIKLGPSADMDGEDVENATLQVAHELREMPNVRAVELASGGELPPGAKSGEAISVGSIVVTLLASGGVITTLISVLKSWLEKHDGAEVIINGNKLTLSDLKSVEKQKIIRGFFQAASKPERRDG